MFARFFFCFHLFRICSGASPPRTLYRSSSVGPHQSTVLADWSGCRDPAGKTRCRTTVLGLWQPEDQGGSPRAALHDIADGHISARAFCVLRLKASSDTLKQKQQKRFWTELRY